MKYFGFVYLLLAGMAVAQSNSNRMIQEPDSRLAIPSPIPTHTPLRPFVEPTPTRPPVKKSVFY